MTNRTLRRVMASVWLIVSLTALAACASGAPVGSGELAGSASSGYAGYSWQVVSVSRHGKVTAIPPRYAVTMQFSPAGQFVASDGVNAYSGTYRAARGAFITSDMAVTLVAYGGNDPILWLTISAMDSLATAAKYPAVLTGGRLVVDIGSYTLTCRRVSHPADA
jgi:heat shock protein HslJ